jgi:3-methyl-2-oxobutanoate hydroxymethyltransferase
MMILEMVPEPLSTALTVELPACHTIGIGAGKGTAGQVLVMHDMLGINLGKNPKFVHNFMAGQSSVLEAMRAYVVAVKNGTFPDNEKHAWA